jgi:hypothetical protein
MPNRTPSAEQSAEIQRQIDALGPPPGEAWHPGAWPTRVCREELNALPLLANEIFTWALRPDGAVLRMDRDSLFHPTEPETDPLTVYAVLERAARESPQLKPMVPDPPAGTRQCTTCGGDGVLEREAGGETRTVLCQRCGGLGWIDYPDPAGA